jgi:hypothetical protein
VKFSPVTVVNNGLVGSYSSLFFDTGNKPTILYFDRTNSQIARAVFASNKWTTGLLGPGGRDIHVARFNSTTAYTNLSDELRVLFL